MAVRAALGLFGLWGPDAGTVRALKFFHGPLSFLCPALATGTESTCSGFPDAGREIVLPARQGPGLQLMRVNYLPHSINYLLWLIKSEVDFCFLRQRARLDLAWR